MARRPVRSDLWFLIRKSMVAIPLVGRQSCALLVDRRIVFATPASHATVTAGEATKFRGNFTLGNRRAFMQGYARMHAAREAARGDARRVFFAMSW